MHLTLDDNKLLPVIPMHCVTLWRTDSMEKLSLSPALDKVNFFIAIATILQFPTTQKLA